MSVKSVAIGKIYEELDKHLIPDNFDQICYASSMKAIIKLLDGLSADGTISEYLYCEIEDPDLIERGTIVLSWIENGHLHMISWTYADIEEEGEI